LPTATSGDPALLDPVIAEKLGVPMGGAAAAVVIA